MMNESTALKEIHDIRLGIYEDIKDMTPEERTIYFSESGHETIENMTLRLVHLRAYPNKWLCSKYK